MKKIFLILILISINFFCLSKAEEKSISIKFKVNEDLITNYDIIKEAQYLLALNKKLEEIDKVQLLKFAEDSLVREKIKKYEIEKFYTVNYEASAVDVYIENIMAQINIVNLSDFEKYLLDYDTNINEVRKKLVIEQTWNKMIFDIYKDRISINEDQISKTLEEIINDKKNQKSFELYEIIFSEQNKESFDKKYNDIISAIDNLGFEKAALLYSISSTASSNGKIGWINQNQLSKKILNEILSLNIGSYTLPINTSGGTMILKVNDIKEISVENLDKELELSNIVKAEKNRQLNEFSLIHYKKTENKSYVKKF